MSDTDSRTGPTKSASAPDVMEVTDILDLVRKLRRCCNPCRLDPLHPQKTLAAFVVANLGANPDRNGITRKEKIAIVKAMQGAVDRAGVLLREKSEALVSAARSMIGEYTTKVSNTAVGGHSVFFRSDVPPGDCGPYAAATTIRCRRRLSGGGTSMIAPAIRFLTARFLFGEDGRCVDLVADIIKEGPIGEMLVGLGLPVESLDRIRASLMEAKAGPRADVPVDGFAKVLLWPVPEDSDPRTVTYHQITPVHSYGMFVELHERIRERRAAGSMISVRTTLVGGMHRQNAGLLNVLYGGRHPHLFGDFPEGRVDDPDMRIAFRVAKGGSLLRSRPSERTLDRVETALDDRRNNLKARETLKRRLMELGLDILADAVEIRRFIAAHGMPDILAEMRDRLGPIETALIFRTRVQEMTPVERAAVERAMTDRMARSLSSHFVDDALSMRLHEAARAALGNL